MTRRLALVLGIIGVTAALAAAVVLAAAPGAIVSLDDAWNLEMVEWRGPVLVGWALVMNVLGGGWVATILTPLVIAALAWLVRGWRGALFALIAFVVSAGVVQLVKKALGRARPQDLLIASDFGSFPSGHTANAATLAVVLWFLFPTLWVAIGSAVWTVAMGFSRTVLSVHWFSDTVGGALIGAGAAFLVAAVLWRWVRLPRVIEEAEHRGSWADPAR
ncbi:MULTISPECIES: phosphatase PAP2 family protein [unclassified Microbacterium]|uniref:phosphatase PAP2 family protein n=1 Tax=unclassified Microbacterium TaxID=2609290 RepID=UPI001E46DF92|nr:phosphatase PAP2 family protein [Microbacterium sp. Au-Mic1]MCE4027756.1 phosphatase PAP2 family protein [Microbacterium sp. Au-Mic1]